MRAWLKESLVVVGSALLLSLILKTFFFQSFWIPSSSMEPTLEIGDRILVTKWRPGPLELRRGDIVVFLDANNWLGSRPEPQRNGLQQLGHDILTFTGLLPDDAGHHLVKRIIGLPGETVVCCDAEGYITIDGVRLVEPYLVDGVEPSRRTFSTVVPEGYVWVMGDNRPDSADSRFHMGDPGGGSIAIVNIVGTAFATVWPLDHWTGIGNPFEDQKRADGEAGAP